LEGEKRGKDSSPEDSELRIQLSVNVSPSLTHLVEIPGVVARKGCLGRPKTPGEKWRKP